MTKKQKHQNSGHGGRVRGRGNPVYMQNVKRYLDLHNISVAVLSRASNISYAHLLRIFSGNYKPRLDTCGKIATGLGITLQELISLINVPVVVVSSNKQDNDSKGEDQNGNAKQSGC